MSTQIDSLLVDYFDAFDGGDFDRAISFYTEEFVCVRPATPSGGMETFRDRAACRAFFDRRGHKPFKRELFATFRDGYEVFAEGVLRFRDLGSGQDNLFMVHVTLDERGCFVGSVPSPGASRMATSRR